MADVTSSVKVTIESIEIFNRNGDECTVKKGSAISENPNDYPVKAIPDTRGRMVIHAELEKTDGSTFKNGDEISIQTVTYEAVGGITNIRLSPNDWTDLSGSNGVVGQWHVNGATGSTRKKIQIKLNSRADGQAVLSNVSMDLGSSGVNFYGVANDIVAKVTFADTTFACGMLARVRGAFNDSVWQSASANNYATVGYRVGTDLYESLVNTRGVSGTKRRILLECLFENASAQNYMSSGFDVGIPHSLTEPNGCFSAGYYMPSFYSVPTTWTKLTPSSSETYNAFKTRVMAHPMQYGFYDVANGVQVVYHFGVVGTDTPIWSDYTTDNVPEEMASLMIADGWYLESDRTALTSLLKSAFETSSIVGKHCVAIRLYTALDYDTVLEDTEYPLTCTITYDPGTSSETVKNISRVVQLTGAFGSVVVKPFSAAVMKYDDETKTPLAGAKIKLQIQRNGAWTDYTSAKTTDSTGVLTFENLALGTYRAVETQAPSGYDLTKSPNYDSDLKAVVSESFTIASTDTEGAKVQMANIQNIQEAEVIYKEITWGDILRTDTFYGMSGTPMEYDAQTVIDQYIEDGYSLVASTYKQGTLFDNDKDTIQTFVVDLRKVDDMANVDCSACTELKEFAPEFVQSGVTKTVCNSLKNDTGLNPRLTTLHNDCDDLDVANDCLVGMMDNEIEKYDVCEWKKFMHKFIPNIHQLTKAEICTICGLWTSVHELEDKTDALCDMLDHQMNPPLVDYAILPLYEGQSSGVITGTVVTSKVGFLPDDGSLNPYTKMSQGIGIEYCNLKTTSCATGKCVFYEWLQPKIYLAYIKEGTTYNDVLWYCKKAEFQEKSGMSDWLWGVYTRSSWTWTDSMIQNGSSRGKGVYLQITVNPGGMGEDYIGVVFRGSTYPAEDTTGYNWTCAPLPQVPRLHQHSC